MAGVALVIGIAHTLPWFIFVCFSPLAGFVIPHAKGS
jgi:hypothetical protein